MPTVMKLYVATTEGGPTKIGISKNPPKRMLTLTGRPTLVYSERIPPELGSAYDIERIAHGLVGSSRVGGSDSEWFNISAEQGIDAVKRALELANSVDCTIAWNVRLTVSPRVKAALQFLADDEEIEVEDLIASLLRDVAATGSTT